MAYVRRSLIAVLVGMFLYWYLDTPLPQDMRETWKVKVIDGAMRTFGHMSQLLYTLGVSEPFSPADRALADSFVITMTTGRPWVQRSDPGLKITDLHTDKSQIHMRLYEPVNSMHVKKRPVLVYMHGGGFSLLSVDSYDAFTRRLARQSGLPVVSINYRLSPQSPFPGPLEDCLEAIDYISSKADSLRIDPQRIAVGGDSAGGNLAASVSLRLRNRIKVQLLLVPFLQLFSFNTTSVVENGQYFSKTTNNMGQLVFAANYIGSGWEYIGDISNSNHTSIQLKASNYASYVDQNKWMDRGFIHSGLRGKDISQKKDFGRNDVSEEFIKKMTDPFLLPLMADESMLRDLPRAYVMTAGYDFIRDDGIMYAKRLKHAGNPVHHVNHRTAFHNALTFVEGPLKLVLADEIVQDIVNYLQIHV